jgi:beta-glucosidase-like glycosyl hydrolase
MSKTKGAAEAAAAQSAATAEFRPVLVVSTTQEGGRRRAGRLFTRVPVAIAIADLTDGETAAIEADPLLSVRRVVEAVAPADAAQDP